MKIKRYFFPGFLNVLSTSLFLALSVILLPGQFLYSLSHTNGIYRITVSDSDGSYTVATGNLHPVPNQNVFFGGSENFPWSTYLTVNSYTSSSMYYSGWSSPSVPSGYTAWPLSSHAMSIAPVANGIQTTWTVTGTDTLTISQNIIVHGSTLESSYVEVSTTVTNNGTANISIGIRYLWDWMIADRDDSWFATRIPDGNWTDIPVGFTNPAFQYYEEVDNIASPTFSIYGSVSGPSKLSPLPVQPDYFAYIPWPDAYANAWNFSLGTSQFDSAVVYFWGYPQANAIELAPNESYAVTQHVGTMDFDELAVSIRDEGQILYVEGISRITSGIRMGEPDATTGNIVVQNISGGQERTVVRNTGGNLILNPSFTADGKKILFTANPGGLFEIFLVSSQAGINLPTAVPIISDATYNLRYAALSPDSDGKTTGFIAYTKDIDPASGTHELRAWDFAEKTERLLVQEPNRQIKHPVFLADGNTVAYVGIKSGIQEIFTVTVSEGLIQKVVANLSPSPVYGRILSNNRKSPDIDDCLIYSKSIYRTEAYSYGKFDVYIYNLVNDTETNVSNTSPLSEYEPAYYGDAATSLALNDTQGNMFYTAAILANEALWQTNFDTDSASNSNLAKIECTTFNAGLANWSIMPTLSDREFPVALNETRLVFNNGGSVEISRADVNSDGTASNPLQITTGGTVKANPSLAGNGGTIVYDDFSGTIINKMNHDGSGGSTISFLLDSTYVKMPDISSDGRWTVYIRDGDLEAMHIPTATRYPLGLGLTDAEYPSFNPDMTQIVFTRNNGANGDKIHMLRVNIDINSNTITAAGAPILLTDTDLHINDRYPSFSMDGKFIIFTSDRWDGTEAIYAMNSGKNGTSGSGVTRIVPAAKLNDSNPFAVFGPVNTDTDNYYVAYVNTSGEIQIATVMRAICTAVSGENLVNDLNFTTGIIPGGKFSWKREREKGSVYAERILQSRADSSENIEYYIKIDVDEAAVSSAFIVEEVLPGWTLPAGVVADILIDGANANAAYAAFLADTPEVGQNTLRIIFGEQLASPHQAQDHLIKITVTPTGSSIGDTFNIMGTVEYLSAVGNTIQDTMGNNTVLIGNPYCPFDIYNAEGNFRMDTDKGIIENFDLFYAIDCWAGDVKLQGYRGIWPLDTLNHYDNILLETITIWSHMPAGGVTGEYVFDSTAPVSAEMYWKSGIWIP